MMTSSSHISTVRARLAACAGFVVALLGVVAGWRLLTYGFPMFIDECYQALAVRNYEIAPLAPLTYWLGNLWTKALGEGIVQLRVLQYLCQASAIGIGAWLLYRCTGRAWLSWVLFGALCAASQMWGMNIYNWDTGCYPFVMATLAASLSYVRRPTMGRAVLMAGAWVLMFASRIPTGLALPFLIALVVWKHRGEAAVVWRQLAVGAGVAVAVLLLLIFCIYGGFTGLMAAWAPDNIINGHTSDGLVRAVSRLKMTILTTGIGWWLGVLMLGGAYIIGHARSGRVVAAAVWLWVMFASVFVLQTLEEMEIEFGVLQPVCFALLFYPLWVRMARGARLRLDLTTGVVLLFVCITVPGSDSMLERFMVIPPLGALMAVRYRCMRRYVAILVPLMALTVATAAGRRIYEQGNHGVGDGGEVFERVEGLRLNKYEMRYLDSLSVSHQYLKEHYGDYIYVLDTHYQRAWLLGDDSVLLNLHTFHPTEFATVRHLVDRNVEAGRAFVIPQLENTRYRQEFIDYLQSRGYVVAEDKPKGDMVLVRGEK